jgi:hypothetical protein
MAEGNKFSKLDYNNLIKFLTLTDTLHDFCKSNDRVTKNIYNYDVETFIHIILGLLKEDFQKIQNIYPNFYTKLYNEKEIWNKTISNIEVYLEKHILGLLKNKGFLDKNYEELLKNESISLKESNDKIKDADFTNILKVNIGKIDESNINNIRIQFYNNLKHNKELTFVTDANTIPMSNDFFCINRKKHKTLYNGIFSQYDAGSHEVKNGGSNNNSNNSNSSNNINKINDDEEMEDNELCIIKDQNSYSLKNIDNELIFVDEIGVKNNSKNKFQLYINIKNQQRFIDLNFKSQQKFKDKKIPLSLPSFIKLLSLIESTITKSFFVNERLTTYFDETLIKNTSLQCIFDIYQIKLVTKSGSSFYKKASITLIKDFQKKYNELFKIWEDIVVTSDELEDEIKDDIKIIFNNDIKKYKDFLEEISELIKKEKIDNIKCSKVFQKKILGLIIKSPLLVNKKFKSELLIDIIDKVCLVEESNEKKEILGPLLDTVENIIKISENNETTVSQNYINLTPIEFSLSLIDFKRSMDYLQVKACSESNKMNSDVNYVFVSQDRAAILFGLLKNCSCIKTTQKKITKENILTLYNLNKDKKNIPIDNNDNKETIYNNIDQNELNNDNANANSKGNLKGNSKGNSNNIQLSENELTFQKILYEIKYIPITKNDEIINKFETLLKGSESPELEKFEKEINKELEKVKKNEDNFKKLTQLIYKEEEERISSLKITPISTNSRLNTPKQKQDNDESKQESDKKNQSSTSSSILKKKKGKPKITKGGSISNKNNSVLLLNQPKNIYYSNLQKLKQNVNIQKNKNIILQNSKNNTKNETENNLNKDIDINLLKILYQSENLLILFFELYEKIFEKSKITFFEFTTYRTLFYLINKIYGNYSSFSDLDKVMNPKVQNVQKIQNVQNKNIQNKNVQKIQKIQNVQNKNVQNKNIQNKNVQKIQKIQNVQNKNIQKIQKIQNVQNVQNKNVQNVQNIQNNSKVNNSKVNNSRVNNLKVNNSKVNNLKVNNSKVNNSKVQNVQKIQNIRNVQKIQNIRNVQNIKIQNSTKNNI